MSKVLLFTCFSLFVLSSAHLPDRLKPYICKRSEINYSECAKKGIEDALPMIVNGIEELNLPPLHPFRVEKHEMDVKISDDIQIHSTVENLQVYGLKDIVIEHLIIDPYKYKVQGGISIPSLYISTDYNIKGTFLSSPIDSQGHFKGNITDIQVNGKVSFNVVEVDGEKYLQTHKLNYKFAIGDGFITVKTKDPSKQAAADFAVGLFNDNPRGMVNAVVPMITQHSRDEIRQHIDEMLLRIPVRELFPDE